MHSGAYTSFSDPYSYQAAIRAADVELVVTKQGEFQAELTRIDLDHVWMESGYESIARISRTETGTKRCAIFFLAAPDEPAMSHDGRDLAFGDIVVYSHAPAYYQRTCGPCRWGAMSLTPEDLAATSYNLVGRELRAPQETSIIRPSKGSFSRLLKLHEKVGSLARTAPQLLAYPETARAIERVLTHAMITCLAENTPIPRTVGIRHHSTVMMRFEQAVAAEPKNPLYLADICAAIGVPERTLRVCCMEHLGMGPARFLWLRRMHLAHQELMKADPNEASVTAIAVEHGFWELGRFSAAHRSLFGESPSATLHRTWDGALVPMGSPFAPASAVSA